MVTEQRRAWEPSAGWYLDPADGRQQRFWDGSQWTQQVRRARRNRRTVLLVLGGLVAFWVVVGAVLGLWFTLEEHRLRPGLAKPLDAVVLPAELRLVSEDYWGNSWCLDACPTLTRRYSSPFSQGETYRVFAAELERLGYQCVRDCGLVNEAETWVQPGKGARAPEFYLAVYRTADLDWYDPDSPRGRQPSSPRCPQCPVAFRRLVAVVELRAVGPLTRHHPAWPPWQAEIAAAGGAGQGRGRADGSIAQRSLSADMGKCEKSFR